MTAARALRVIRVDRAALERGDRRFDEARFVERVRVNGDLRVRVVGNRKTVVDGSGRRAPVLVQLEADRARLHLLDERRGQARVALAEKAEIDRPAIGGLQHALHVPRSGRACGRVRAGGGAGAAAEHRRDAACECFVDLLRADEVDMRIDTARGHDHAFARDDLRGRADRDVHVRLDVGIARLADSEDAPALDADVGLHDAPVIDDQRVGDDGIDHVGGDALRLAHAVANHLAAAELHFLAIRGEVALDLDDEIGIGEAHAVAGGRAEHFGIGAAADA